MPNQAVDDTYHRILETLNSLSRDILANGSPTGMLQKILSAGTDLLPVTICSLWRSENAQMGGVLQLAGVQGVNGGRPFPRVLKLAGSISRRVIDGRQYQTVPDLKAEPGAVESAIASQYGLASLLALPIACEGPEPVGVLNCFTHAHHQFSRLETHIAVALARQVGIVWQMDVLKGETQRAREALKTRKRVDRAKEILMEQRDMSAEEAYRWIQKRSMDSRRSMRDVAETIIISEASGHYTSIPHALDLLGDPTRK